MLIDNVEIASGQLVRFEFNTVRALSSYHKSLNRDQSGDYTVIRSWGNLIARKSLLNSLRVEAFVNQVSNLNSTTNSLFNVMDISVNSKVNKLSDVQQEILFLACFSASPGSILVINTGGMYLDALVECYKIIRQVLKKGAGILELTYPPIEDGELEAITGVAPRIIRMDHLPISSTHPTFAFTRGERYSDILSGGKAVDS